jgi:hypothetical protein
MRVIVNGEAREINASRVDALLSELEYEGTHFAIAVNGLYRHGFLLAPALAELTLGYVERGVIDNEVMQCA